MSNAKAMSLKAKIRNIAKNLEVCTAMERIDCVASGGNCRRLR